MRHRSPFTPRRSHARESEAEVSDDCPGTGKCHGPMGWCDRCGDVDRVCHDDSRKCMAHFCGDCGRGPTSILDYICDACRDQQWIEDIEGRMIRAIERGDEFWARRHAETIERFNKCERINVEFVRWDGGP